MCVCFFGTNQFVHKKLMKKITTFGVFQISLKMQDAANGNWRLKVDNDARELGFWPKNIFTALGDGANYVEWGGEVYSPPDLPSPPMGSGSSILETTRYDAYCRLIKTFNETDYAVNAVSTKAFSDVNQYQVKDEGDTGEAYFQHLVLFGGPGGYTGP